MLTDNKKQKKSLKFEKNVYLLASKVNLKIIKC